MTTEAQIEAYITAQPEPKRSDLRTMHQIIQRLMPGARLWFLDGKNADGKTVTNPNLGYGVQAMTYADKTSRDFYQIGLSANTGGLSLYIIGLADKTHLARTYGPTLGKATISGYCIKFKRLADLDLAVLQSAIVDGVAQTG